MGTYPESKARFVPLALLIAVVAVSFAAIFFRKAAPTHPLVAAGIRLAVAAIVLLPWTIRSALDGRLRGKLLSSAALAGVLYGIHFGSWVTSLALTSIAASVTIVTTTPLLLAIVGATTKHDKPDKRLWSTLLLAFIGLSVIGGKDITFGTKNLIGDGLALMGAIAMAGYLLVGRRLGNAMHLLAFSGVATAVGAISLLGSAVIVGIPIKAASREAFGYLVLAALIPQLIGHNLLTWSLRYTKPMVVSMAVVGEPVGATILGIIWLGEMVSLPVGIGCAITLLAVVLAIRFFEPTPVE